MVKNEIIIEIKGEVKDIQKSLASVKKDLADLKKGTEKSGEGVDSLKKSFAGLQTGILAVKGVIASVVAREMYDFIKSSAEASDQFRTFALMAGETSDALLHDLSSAAKGAVSNADLMAASMRAIALGIDESQLPGLMEAAAARAKVMGITTSQAFGDIATGVGRESKMILDNLGIVLDTEKVYKDYALTLGKTVEELTNFERKQALSNEIIKQTSGLVQVMNYGLQSSSDIINQYEVNVKNLWSDMLNYFGKSIAEIDLESEAKRQGLTVDWDVVEQMEAKKVKYLELTRLEQEYRQELQSTQASIKGFSANAYTLPGELEMRGVSAGLNKEMAGEELALAKTQAALKARGVSVTSLHDYYGGLGKGATVDEGTVNLLKIYEKEKAAVEDVRERRNIAQLEYQQNIVTTKDVLQQELDMEKGVFQDTIKTQEEIRAVFQGLKDTAGLLTGEIGVLNDPARPESLPAFITNLDELSRRKYIPINIKLTIDTVFRGRQAISPAILDYIQSKVNTMGG